MKEPFKVVDPDGRDGVIEQVDGLLRLGSRLFLTEIKWLGETVGKGLASEHLVRMYHRPEVHGLFVSATPLSKGAKAVCREAILRERIIVMCTLQEIVQALEAGTELGKHLESRVIAVIQQKDPFAQA